MVSRRTASGFHPKKSLGQHFLSDPGIVSQIIRKARFGRGDPVLEIGPGQGALTLSLARGLDRLIAVEKDTRLTAYLAEKLSNAGLPHVLLINQDILTWDFHEASIPPGAKLQVIGNLPYNISSPLLEKLIRNRAHLGRAVLMLQKEVAERITASPGTKAYGALSVWIRYHACPARLIRVPRQAFYPRPQVGSTVLELDFEKPYPRRAPHAQHFKDVVKWAFSHRRKTLLNSLDGSPAPWSRGQILSALNQTRIDPTRRAETLDMEAYLDLAEALS